MRATKDVETRLLAHLHGGGSISNDPVTERLYREAHRLDALRPVPAPKLEAWSCQTVAEAAARRAR